METTSKKKDPLWQNKIKAEHALSQCNTCQLILKDGTDWRIDSHRTRDQNTQFYQ
jgi:hypothetical protein